MNLLTTPVKSYFSCQKHRQSSIIEALVNFLEDVNPLSFLPPRPSDHYSLYQTSLLDDPGGPIRRTSTYKPTTCLTNRFRNDRQFELLGTASFPWRKSPHTIARQYHLSPVIHTIYTANGPGGHFRHFTMYEVILLC